MHGGAGERPQLHAKNLRPQERQTNPAHSQKRIALALERETCNRLVAAGVQGADGHGPALRPLDDTAIGGVLRVLVGKARAAMKQELGADKADAVAGRRIEPVELVRIGTH